MKESLIDYAEYLNLLQPVLTPEQLYLLAYKIIPQQKHGYIKYIGKAVKKERENVSEQINNNNNVEIYASKLFEL